MAVKLFVGGLSFGAFLALHGALQAAASGARPPAGCILLSPPFRLRSRRTELLLARQKVLRRVDADGMELHGGLLSSLGCAAPTLDKART